jgi:muconolactone delta-isomerase
VCPKIQGTLLVRIKLEYTLEKPMKLKKLIVFVLVFAAVYGITAVDEAYSDMMDREGKIALHVRRVNSEYVTFSMFGQTGAVNIKKLYENWRDFSNTVVGGLDMIAADIQDFLGIEEPARDYTVFQTEIL